MLNLAENLLPYILALTFFPLIILALIAVVFIALITGSTIIFIAQHIRKALKKLRKTH
jgi:uncharacterized integral membrane protein